MFYISKAFFMGLGKPLMIVGYCMCELRVIFFTWERGRGMEAWVEERLNRVVANGDWCAINDAMIVVNCLT